MVTLSMACDEASLGGVGGGVRTAVSGRQSNGNGSSGGVNGCHFDVLEFDS